MVGVAFSVTACAYALLMVRATRPDSSGAARSVSPVEEGGLMKLLDEHGMEILGVEVLLLALATIGAIGLDQYRSAREKESSEANTDSGPEQSPRRGQTLVAESETPGLNRQQIFDPEGQRR